MTAGWKAPSDCTTRNRQLGALGPAGANVFNKKLTHFNSQTGKCNIQKSPWSLFSDYWEWMKPKGNETVVYVGAHK